MKQPNNNPLAEASIKLKRNPVNFQFDRPLLEMILETKAAIESLGNKTGILKQAHKRDLIAKSFQVQGSGKTCRAGDAG